MKTKNRNGIFRIGITQVTIQVTLNIWECLTDFNEGLAQCQDRKQSVMARRFF